MSGPEPSAPPAPIAAAGFIGLGAMGGAIALRLLEQGVPLFVTTRSPERAAPVLAAGAGWKPRASEVARAVPGGLVFVMVPELCDVERVLFGRAGLARAAAPGTLVVDLSTIGPEGSRGLAARLTERGIDYLDVPVGGSTDAARAGTLLLFVGGSSAALERARPYLRRFSRAIEPMGEIGAGSAMKLVNNVMTIGTVELLSEAIVLGERLGLPRERILSVLAEGGGRSAQLDAKRPLFAAGSYPPSFRLALARKDVRLAESAIPGGREALPGVHAVRRALDRAVNDGLGDEDFSAVVRSLERPPGARAERSDAAGSPPPTG